MTSEKKKDEDVEGSLEKFIERLDVDDELIFSYISDPWGTAEKEGVSKEYIKQAKHYQEKIEKEFIKQMNKAIKEKADLPKVVAAEGPTTKAIEDWEARLERVEITIFRRKILIGYKLILNNALAESIGTGIGLLTAVTAAIAVIPGALAIAGPIAAALGLQAALIGFMNSLGHNGVHYYIPRTIWLRIKYLGPAGLISCWKGPLPN